MKLTRFRVQNFRAVKDTGWINCQDVTAFAGENESGKTTLLLALLKFGFVAPTHQHISSELKSVETKRSEIDLEADLPLSFNARQKADMLDKEFIFVEFKISEEMKHRLREMLLFFNEHDRIFVSRKYNGEYNIQMPERYSSEVYDEAISYILSKLPKLIYYQEVFEIDSQINLVSLALKLQDPKRAKNLTSYEAMISNLLYNLDIWESNLVSSIQEVYAGLNERNSHQVDFRVVFERIPLLRARVEKGFIKLNEDFKKWWDKDDLTITYEPDQKGLTIIVKDHEGNRFKLENRSTGFRRFFSMFLSFSVISNKDYESAIMLFDEAGAALHPLMQRKFMRFLNLLSEKTQILYNTHTSYMLDVAQMNRVKVVYKNDDKVVCVSDNLTLNADRSNEMSLFPVQSAYAHYVAEKALAGCWPVIVLSESDENYLSLTKNMLSARGVLTSVYNILVFSTGANGIEAACDTFSDGDDYPVILLPSTEAAKKIKKRLIKGKYKNCQNKVLEISDFLPNRERFEDLIPSTFIEMFSRQYLIKILDSNFKYSPKQDLLTQIEEYATEKDIFLPSDYRIEIAKRLKITTMLNFKDVIVPSKYTAIWKKIWSAILNPKK
ncbi:MAG: ATP-binding protein [Firmicutes bacterium]|nr:ATP-binding protein [Bacillota bacterium]